MSTPQGEVLPCAYAQPLHKQIQHSPTSTWRIRSNHWWTGLHSGRHIFENKNDIPITSYKDRMIDGRNSACSREFWFEVMVMPNTWIHHHHLFAFTYNKNYSRLLGEETSENHQAYRRGHFDITILNEIKAAKECDRNCSVTQKLFQ